MGLALKQVEITKNQRLVSSNLWTIKQTDNSHCPKTYKDVEQSIFKNNGSYLTSTFDIDFKKDVFKMCLDCIE